MYGDLQAVMGWSLATIAALELPRATRSPQGKVTAVPIYTIRSANGSLTLCRYPILARLRRERPAALQAESINTSYSGPRFVSDEDAYPRAAS
jgi:hypothetical protein